MKSRLIRKDPDAGKDGGLKEKEVAEDEMVRYHHWPNGHESEQTLGDSEGQGSLVCCVHGVPKSQTQLSNWTTISLFILHRVVCTSVSCPIFFLSTSLSLVTTSLFSLFVNLFPFLLYPPVYFLDSTCKLYQTVFAILWLISLSILHSKSICVVSNGKISFSFMVE